VNGGTVGSIAELNGQLVITQTTENLREVNRLLSKLRETRAIQINVETRFLTVQRNYLERVGVDFDFQFNFENPPGPGETGIGPIAVDTNSTEFTRTGLGTGVPGSLGAISSPDDNALSTQFTAFLDNFQATILLEALQQRQDVQSLTSPNLTLFNGQQAFIVVARTQSYVAALNAVSAAGVIGYEPQIAQAQDGITVGVQATVSNDRRYVTLTLEPTLQRIGGFTTFQVTGGAAGVGGGIGGGPGIIDGGGASPPSFVQLANLEITALATTVSVPDGGTLLLGGQTITGEVTRESGVPVISKIPFLKRLFTNTATAKDEQVLLILVRPRIIIQREVENETFPLLAAPGS
jgi:general secretion pathway protein D